MKNRIKIILISLLILVVGCDDWLDVSPKAVINEKTMFGTQKGFEDVLYGIYTSMTKNSLYGESMTFGFLDALAQYYDAYGNKNHYLYYPANFDYENEASVELIRKLWLDSYNVIANCNILLENIDKKGKTFFTNDRYEIIKGEALAIKAYMHFDLLRLFTPTYSENKDYLGIPYVDSFTRTIHQQQKTEQVVDKITEDLEAARELLKSVDPILESYFNDPNLDYHFSQPIPGSGDEFLSFRCYRMNYYAVTALLARIYSYKGSSKAVEYANELIQKNEDGLFPFTKEAELSSPESDRDRILSKEIIFGLNRTEINNNYNLLSVNPSKMLNILSVDQIYESADDYRKLYLTDMNETYYTDYSLKYSYIKNNPYSGKIPLIRITEMYYIACEYYINTDKQKAVNLLRETILARGVNSSINEDISKDEFIEEISAEVKREFLGEGQTFFFNKKHNKPFKRGNAIIEMSPKNYVLPLPATEVEFGNRESELYDK